MKKKFLVFIALIFLTPFFTFANFMAQMTVNALSGSCTFYHSCFSETTDSVDFDFLAIQSVNGSLFWEFNSDAVENNVHFLAGLDCGLEPYGLALTPVFGASIKLHEFNNLRLELVPMVEAGPLGTMFGDVLFFWRESVEVSLLSKNRRGLYGSLGLGNTNILITEFFVSYGNVTNLVSFLGLSVSAGIRI